MRHFPALCIVYFGLHTRPERKERTTSMCEYIPLYPTEETKRVPYAMAFVRMQDWERPLNADEALHRGTAFSSLIKPFTGKEAQQ